MYKEDKQWLTITNPTARDENSKDSSTKTNIIDTFTNDIDDSRQILDSYNVSGDVASLIAQKMSTGERIRIGRNGESITNKNKNNNKNDTDFSLNNEHFFDDLIKTETPIVTSGSILSWVDQMKQTDIKIIKPKIEIIREDKSDDKQKTRNLIVKKLVDEEAFKPKLRESLLNKKDQKKKQVVVNNCSNYQRYSGTQDTFLPVNVISLKSIGNETTKISTKPDNNTVSTKKLNTKQSDKLTEKNYLQIIDNLTSPYTASMNFNGKKKTSSSSSKNISQKVK
jgi:hypothetical protein